MSGARTQMLQKKLQVGEAISAAGGDGEAASRKAVMNVVQVWLDRLQLISVITTFFASIDGTLLSFTIGLTHPGTLDTSQWPNTVQVLNASLAGALIFHVCAASTSFVGSFMLIRYKLNDADANDVEVMSTPATASSTPFEKSTSRHYDSQHTTLADTPPLAHTRTRSAHAAAEHHTGSGTPFMQATQAELAALFGSWCVGLAALDPARVSVHTVRPFFCVSPRDGADRSGTAAGPPVRLLSNCHTLAAWMAVAGFVLALVGILVFAWTALPTGVGAFASACLGTCLVALLATLSLS